MRKILPIIGVTCLVTVGALSGIAVYKKQNTVNENIEDENTQETVDDVENINILLVNGKTTTQLAEESYNTYKDFYDNVITGRNITIKEIDTMINVLNDNVEGYSQDEIKDSLRLIQEIYLSGNLVQSIDNVNAQNNPDVPYIPDSCPTYMAPKVSDFISPSNVNDNIIKYEQIRDELTNEIILTGTYSEDMANRIRNAILDMEIDEYNKDIDGITTEISSEGLRYAAIAANYSLAKLGPLVTPNASYLYREGEISIQIALTPEQNDLESAILMSSNNLSDDIILQNAKNKEQLITTKYIRSLCNIEVLILQNAGYSTDDLISSLNEEKETLLYLKSFNEGFLKEYRLV